MQDEKLIEAVRRRPFLYVLKDPKYMDTKYKNIAWRDIAKEVGVPADNCKKRWQCIRGSYRKHRARDNAARSGQAAASARLFKFGNILDFLAPSFEERAMVSSLDDEEISGTSEDVTEATTASEDADSGFLSQDVTEATTASEDADSGFLSQEVTAATTASEDADSGFLSQDVTAATTASTDTASGLLSEGEEDDFEPPPKRGRRGGDVSDTINRCADLIERSITGNDENASQAFQAKVRLVRFFKTMALEVFQLSRRTQDTIKMNLLRDISEKRDEEERQRELHDRE